MVTLKKLKSYFTHLLKQNDELIWAKTWDDTKKGIAWADSIERLSPGRMAVGYNYLYVMTRVLNEFKPKYVLDLGLGISSTLISSYFDYMKYENAYHTIIEHDDSWIDFYCKNRELSSYSEVILQKIKYSTYKNCQFMSYDNLKSSINTKKYSVISIDAPIGSDKKYSRRDILELLPDVLCDEFVIVLDDVDRIGEMNTVKDIEKTLSDHEIDYCTSIYYGIKDVCVIASKNNKFFCSL